MPENSLSLIERYGSFGMLCLIFVWVAMWLTPKVLDLINRQRTEFLASLTKEQDQRATLTTAVAEISRNITEMKNVSR